MRVIGIAFVTTFAVIILRPSKPEVAALVGLAGGILCVLMFVQSLNTVLENLASIVARTGVRSDLFSALLRIIGIAYLTEFAASICHDAGNTSMAQKVTLAGKVMILVLALPIVNNLVEIVMGVMP